MIHLFAGFWSWIFNLFKTYQQDNKILDGEVDKNNLILLVIKGMKIYFTLLEHGKKLKNIYLFLSLND